MSLDTAFLLEQQDYKAFFLHRQAVEVIDAMFVHTHRVGGAYGVDSAEYTEQVNSLIACLTAVFGRTGFGRRMSITRDGELSLFCNEDGAYVFGMVFHRDRGKHGAAVVPGTWSLHS